MINYLKIKDCKLENNLKDIGISLLILNKKVLLKFIHKI